MNACIVGYGAVGPVHAFSVFNSEYANLYAVCDIDLKRAEKCSKEYGCVVYDDFDKMLGDSNIDVVHICTPHFLHKEMLIKALKSKKRVVLEKPVGINNKELEEIVEFVNKNNLQNYVCVMLQNRTNNCVKKLRQVISQDGLGSPSGIVGMMTWRRDEEYYNQDVWRGKWKTEGGGVMINQAVHLLDLMVYFGGKVKSIKSNISRWKITNIEVEDTAEALIEFENGTTGIFNASNCYVSDEPFYLDLRFSNRHLRYADGFLYDIDSEGCRIIAKDDKVKIGKSYWGNGHGNVIDSFYRYINGQNTEFTNIIESVETMKLLYRFYDKEITKL